MTGLYCPRGRGCSGCCRHAAPATRRDEVRLRVKSSDEKILGSKEYSFPYSGLRVFRAIPHARRDATQGSINYTGGSFWCGGAGRCAKGSSDWAVTSRPVNVLTKRKACQAVPKRQDSQIGS